MGPIYDSRVVGYAYGSLEPALSQQKGLHKMNHGRWSDLRKGEANVSQQVSAAKKPITIKLTGPARPNARKYIFDWIDAIRKDGPEPHISGSLVLLDTQGKESDRTNFYDVARSRYQFPRFNIDVLTMASSKSEKAK